MVDGVSLAAERQIIPLEVIAQAVTGCHRCDLSATRTRAVPGSGPAHSEIFLVGEGPGFNEDQQGLPFVGAAGKYLDQLLSLAGLTRSQVFITNVVKCRPPGNRDPLPDEIAACSAYLDQQLEAIDPIVVVTLGRFSMAKWFPVAKISRIHGQEKQFGRLTVIPMYHPAAALRNPDFKQQLEADFAALPRIIDSARRGRFESDRAPESEGPALDQLKLF
jgi:DNA polymerase